MGTTFELGVTRTVAMTSSPTSSSSSSNNSTSSSSAGQGNNGEPAPDYLKEATAGETFTQAGITADLLF
jgi:hypothetical protein